MTFSLHAFSTSDTAFDVQASALEDPRPHPTEAALVQLGHAVMTELLDVICRPRLPRFVQEGPARAIEPKADADL